jgi:hypothetical protein
MKPLLTLLALPFAAFSLVSCDSPSENAREDAGERRADALEERADSVRDADSSGTLGTTGAAAERRADALEERADEVREATDE